MVELLLELMEARLEAINYSLLVSKSEFRRKQLIKSALYVDRIMTEIYMGHIDDDKAEGLVSLIMNIREAQDGL